MTPIQIRKPDVVNDIRALAALTGKSITDVVAESVRARLAEAQRERHKDFNLLMHDIHELQARLKALPVLGPPLTDADLYDEDGLPRTL
ncbi:MAG TPA: type II toxin-antitoxin system VapB family antitoxin [Bryobacteraceae bacterium]|nr:type II toxin-antitoxin system VapB family antitoxin [Bryobacteraceae bacterium]